jgi:probable phosphoglycerate mutase
MEIARAGYLRGNVNVDVAVAAPWRGSGNFAAHIPRPPGARADRTRARAAERAAERVKAGWPQVAAIFCSPRHRTVATAEAVGRRYGLAPQPVSEFDDIDYGTWQGLSHDEAKQRWPEQFSLWTSAPDCMVFPNGESLAELAARVWGGLQQVLQKTKAASDAVVVVAHDSTNRALLMQILGMHLRFYRALAQDPCCLNVVDQPGPDAQVRLLNATDHLRGL